MGSETLNLRRRTFLQLGAAGAAILASPSLPSFGQGKTTLRFAFFGPSARAKTMQQVAQDFTKKNPDISLALEFAAIGAYETKYTVAMASNSLPDVFWVPGDILPQLVQGHHLVDVSKYYGKGLNNAEFNQAVTQAGYFDGAQYALTFALQSIGVFAKKKILDAVGIPIKKYPDAYSWDEYAKACLAIHKAKGPNFYGTDDPTYVGETSYVRAFARQHGENYWTDKGDIGFSRDTLTKWLTYWQDMRQNGAAIPIALHMEQNPYFEGSPMIRGLTAYHMRNSNQLLELQRLTDDQIVLMPCPGNGGAGVVNVCLDANMIGVAANTANLEASIRLLDYMMNDPDHAKIMGTTIGAPSTASLRQAIKPTVTPPEAEFLDFINFEASVKSKPVPMAPPNGGAFDTAFGKAVQAMAYGQASVQQTVDQVFGPIRDKLKASS